MTSCMTTVYGLLYSSQKIILIVAKSTISLNWYYYNFVTKLGWSYAACCFLIWIESI